MEEKREKKSPQMKPTFFFSDKKRLENCSCNYLKILYRKESGIFPVSKLFDRNLISMHNIFIVVESYFSRKDLKILCRCILGENRKGQRKFTTKESICSEILGTCSESWNRDQWK